jgi:DDE superfamily endonuclease
VPAPGQAKTVAIIRAFDPAARRLVVHTSKTKRSPHFIALLQQLDGLDGPRPGLPIKAVVIVVDDGPIHISRAARAALAAGAHWLTVEWLPKYTPEFNDTEPVWRDFKAHHLAHQTFTDADDLNISTAPFARCDDLEHRAKHQSVGQTKSLCHEIASEAVAAMRFEHGFEDDAPSRFSS